MNWIEVHNCEYGECIVIGSKDESTLMVDCGSMNNKIHNNKIVFSNYVKNTIMNRYAVNQKRDFLLTHYHRDHMCGLKYILQKNSEWFQKIYLPCVPVDINNNPLALRFSLYAYAFLSKQTRYSQINSSQAKIFKTLLNNSLYTEIIMIGKDDRFYFDGINYEVLAPSKKNYCFTHKFIGVMQKLNNMLDELKIYNVFKKFLNLSDEFCNVYVNISDKKIVTFDDREKINFILGKIDDIAPSLSVFSSQIEEYMMSEEVSRIYSEQVNELSIVFQNDRSQSDGRQNILFTGDTTPRIIDKLENKLYPDYYILKAPHHGTKSSWNNSFINMDFCHVIISNGIGTSSGLICSDYTQLNSMKHCTNCSVCEWYKNTNASCSRSMFCGDLEPVKLALHCKGNNIWHNHGSGVKIIPCGIFLVQQEGLSGCICDENNT